MRRLRTTILLLALCAAGSTSAQESISDILGDPALDLSRPADRARAVRRIEAVETDRRDKARARAAARGLPLREELPNGRVREIAGFRGNKPLYFVTQNANAAISTGANLLRVSPYSLNGAGLTVGVWDGGSGRASHQEFGGRLVSMDGASSIDHATHVAGTIGAAGVVSSARGMANAVSIDSYDWNNDSSEMTSRGAATPGEAGKIQLSNHSYGYTSGWTYVDGGFPYRKWEWYGSGTTSAGVETDFGVYNAYARDSDLIAFNAPYYLMFRSAGNERTDNPANGDAVALSPGSPTVTTYNSTSHPPGDGTYRGGYDSMSFNSVAKNVITIGSAADAVTSGLRDVSKAYVSSFSSWGPTDDGRIKPDVVANGEAVYSCLNTSNTSYGSYYGTSMSTPNACGSAALLVEFYGELFPGDAMRASTLKGLLIHTADDRGNTGPDYQYGWGLVNVKAAADQILDHHDFPIKQRITEAQLTTASPTHSYPFVWDGVSPIVATICWTDPAGSSTTTSDSRTSRLVNNLNLKLVAPGGTEHFPFVMPFVGTWTQGAMSLPATTGINNTDNVEQVRLASPAQAGTYVAVVSYSGGLTNNSQPYSLLLDGAADEEPPPPPLALSSVSPSSAYAGHVTMDVNGTGLAADTTVLLGRAGETDIPATSTQLLGDLLRCEFDLSGAAAGSWDVVASNPALETSTLPGAFEVLPSLFHEDFEGTVTGWSSTSESGSNSWVLTTAASHSTATAYFAAGPGSQSTTSLVSPTVTIPSGATNLQLRFWHSHDLQSGKDGAVLEFSTNGGASWFDVESTDSGALFASNGYNSTLRSRSNDFNGLPAWSGNSGGFKETVVNLTDTAKYAGSDFRMRWRLGTDSRTASYGWHVDDIVLIGDGDVSNQPPVILAAADSSSTETETDPDTTIYQVVRSAATSLTVAADDDGGEPALSYTWSAAAGPAAVSFVPNGTNAAKTCDAEFQAPGDYELVVAVSDPEGLTVTSSVNIRVIATADGIQLNPAAATLTVGDNQAFTATMLDQFGAALSPQPGSFTWTASGGGTIDANGLFHATDAGGPFVVTASADGWFQTANVTVNPALAVVTLGGLAQTYDGNPKPVSVTTDPPGLPCSVTYGTETDAPVDAGTYQVEVLVTDPNFQGAANGELVVAKAAQTISFAPPGPMTYGDAPFDAGATCDSGLAVSYVSSDPSVATVSGSTVTIVGAGGTTLTATQAGDNNHEPAPAVDRLLTVAKALATVTLDGLEQTYDGTPKTVSAATDPAGLTVDITYDGSTDVPIGIGTYAVVATVNDENHQGSATGSLVVSPGDDWLSWQHLSFDESQITSGLAAEDADPDFDQLANLAEYALGTDPLAFTPPFVATLDETGLWFTFTRPAGLPDVSYAAESSDGPGTWTPALLEVIGTGETETVRARDPLATGDPTKRFLRLKFTKP